jgi:hypothetical protein
MNDYVKENKWFRAYLRQCTNNRAIEYDPISKEPINQIFGRLLNIYPRKLSLGAYYFVRSVRHFLITKKYITKKQDAAVRKIARDLRNKTI